MAAPAVLEQGDVFLRPRAREAVAAEIEQIPLDPIGAEPPLPDRLEEVAADPDRGLSCIHEHPRALERLGIRFAHLGLVSADQVQVLARPQPGTEHQRRFGRGRRGDDVGVTAGSLDVGGRFECHAFHRGRGGERFRFRVGPVPYRHALDGRPHRAVCPDEMRGLRAGSDHAQRSGVLASQEPGAERGVRSRLPVGELGSVEARERPAVLAVEEHVHRLDGRKLPAGVGRKHGDELDSDLLAPLPRGADEQSIGALRRGRLGHEQVVHRVDGVEMAVPQPFDQVGIARDRLHLDGVDDVHVRLSGPSRQDATRRRRIPAPPRIMPCEFSFRAQAGARERVGLRRDSPPPHRPKRGPSLSESSRSCACRSSRTWSSTR